MDKKKIKILDSIMKDFKEKGYDTTDLEEYIEEGYENRKEKLHKVRKITDLKDMMMQSYKLFGDRPLYVYKTDKPDVFRYTYMKDFVDNVNALGTKLIQMGLKGKRIAVISENREEWGIAYMATVCGTGVIVPLDKLLPANELESLIIRSGVEAIFYSSKYDEMMMDIKKRKTTDLRYYISMDLDKKEKSTLSQKELIEDGKELIKNGNRSFLHAKINNEEMAIMLFTSGTTAMSKAVMLSHKNIVTNLMDIGKIIELTDKDRFLSLLPLHHTFECTVGFLHSIYKGCSTAFCDGLIHIQKNIKEYHVTCMIAVPALYEIMYKKILKQIEKEGKMHDVETGIKITSTLSKFGINIKRRIFKEIHEAFGGKLRLCVNGGAALDATVEKGFNDFGIKIYQGYGLTETSPVISAGNDFVVRFGSVGRVLPSVKVKIVDKDDDGIGEVWAKGDSIMLGYYNNEEANNSTFEKGWLKTGDLGYIDKDGFLWLSGRKKSVIVLTNGKNVYPEEIENVINRIEGVKESFVYGKPENGDKNDLRLCVKIVYDKDLVKEAYKVTKEEDILSVMKEKIKEVNKTMPTYKYIKDVQVTEEPLIKTTTLKIKTFQEMKKMGLM